jgi:histone H3/H4
MRRLIQKFGELKISEGAAEEMRSIIGEYGLKIAENAVSNAIKDGRKTVLDRDVREAKRILETEEE